MWDYTDDSEDDAGLQEQIKAMQGQVEAMQKQIKELKSENATLKNQTKEPSEQEKRPVGFAAPSEFLKYDARNDVWHIYPHSQNTEHGRFVFSEHTLAPNANGEYTIPATYYPWQDKTTPTSPLEEYESNFKKVPKREKQGKGG